MPRRSGSSARPRAAPARSGAIAVTGLNRFVGAEMLKWLTADSDRRVIGLDLRRPKGEWPKSFVYYRVDLTDPSVDESMADLFREERVETVLHTAFHAFPQPNAGEAHELESIGTMQLLHACAEVKIRKLVVPSSTMVYGAHPKNPYYLDETMPTAADSDYPFVADKVDAERQIARFRQNHPETVVTVLRFAPLIGPRGDHFMERLLASTFVLRVLGFDPLMQLLHEDDAVDAVRKAISEDHDGIFNVVPSGVLPFSTLIRIAGRFPLPLPSGAMKGLSALLWTVQLGPFPPGHVDFLKYLNLAAGDRMERIMGFRPRYSTREALDSYLGTQRLRRVRLAAQPIA